MEKTGERDGREGRRSEPGQMLPSLQPWFVENCLSTRNESLRELRKQKSQQQFTIPRTTAGRITQFNELKCHNQKSLCVVKNLIRVLT